MQIGTVAPCGCSRTRRTPIPRLGLLRTKHISHTIQERSDQITRRKEKGSRGGGPPAFDVALDRHRNTVERGFNRLEHWRGVATRYDKSATPTWDTPRLNNHTSPTAQVADRTQPQSFDPPS
ncbi:hypothetical protein CJ179_35885 [Rhodococcus sp. ACS1]|nr:hypothetical protein CJ179_35885 [Rhodococcus sp. ACS1]